MAPTRNKANISTDIGEDVIRDALNSVEKRSSKTRGAPAAGEETEEAAEAAEAAGPEVDSEAATQAPAAPEPSPQEKEIEELKAQLELSQAKGREMMEKIKDSHEKMLRAVADLENFKKRAQKEKEEVQKYGAEKLLKDLLPVADNLDRALEHAKTGADFEALRTGVQMTRKLLDDSLGKNGIKAFSARGKPFDPNLHEAVQQVETTEVPPNHVVMEVVRGYTLNDRLVRPAMVVVAKAPEGADKKDKEADAGEKAQA